MFGIPTTGNAVFMAGTRSRTIVSVQSSHDIGDTSGDHPRFLKILVLLPFDTRPESVRTSIEFGKLKAMSLYEIGHLRLPPISTCSWPFEQNRDGAGAAKFPIQPYQLIEQSVEQLVVLVDQPPASRVLAVWDLPW